jgi:thymidylate synthase
MKAGALKNAMYKAINTCYLMRKSTDIESPMQECTYEAIGQSFVLDELEWNVPGDVKLQWALANILHFFAETEEAEVLQRYNQRAHKFLDADHLKGAYGPILMPQLRACRSRLKENFSTRRAVAYMHTQTPENINIPACWTSLHFLSSAKSLDLLVYQRSMNMAVMPYDCSLLTNILNWITDKPGVLRWFIGSLHSEKIIKDKDLSTSLIVPREILDDGALCFRALLNPEILPEPLRSILNGL